MTCVVGTQVSRSEKANSRPTLYAWYLYRVWLGINLKVCRICLKFVWTWLDMNIRNFRLVCHDFFFKPSLCNKWKMFIILILNTQYTIHNSYNTSVHHWYLNRNIYMFKFNRYIGIYLFIISLLSRNVNHNNHDITDHYN